MAVSRRSMVATDNFSAHEARYSAKSAGLAGVAPPLAEKCFKSEAYARFVAFDWLAAMKSGQQWRKNRLKRPLAASLALCW